MVMNYKKGTRSRIYSLSETVLRGKINRYRNKDKVLIKKYKTNVIDTSSSSNLIESEIKTKLISDLFSVKIEIERSIFYLDSLKNESLDIYNRNKYSVESIHENSIFYHFDSYGRLHTNFTILKSFIRKNCLLIDGYETCEKDIHNSQPLFLAKLIHDTGTKWVNPDELKLFGNLTLSGNYYKYLMNSFGIKDKSHVKEMTYKVLFGRNGVTSKVDIMFSKLFPTIHNFIKLYKKEMGDYRVLAHELQREESNLIFNKIIKSIVSVNPDIKIITVHDSIIFPVIYRDLVDPIFDRMVNEEFSFLR
jgi:hypothetical protein